MSISTVFTNNRTQAVRLPSEMRLPAQVKKVDVRARGLERVIAPVGHTWDSFFGADALTVSDDFMRKRATQKQAKRPSL
jgi:antitoxin VapB